MSAGKGSRQRPTDAEAFNKNFEAIFGRKSCCEHDSDCAVHNEPAYPAGPCDCSKKHCEDPSEVIKRPRTGCQGGKCKHASGCAVPDSESDCKCDCDESWPFEQDTSVPKPVRYRADGVFTDANGTPLDNDYNKWLNGSVLKPPEGYTAEELERDNPYNQWMNEKKCT